VERSEQAKMRTEVWIENALDGEEKQSLIFKSEDDVGPLVLPSIGEQIGVDPLWDDEFSKGTNAAPLFYVVAVRHFFIERDGQWTQEIHVMTSSHG
jgi:hypothetical protein